MPIFEYSCEGCGASFEAIVSRSTKVRCPKCDGAKLHKLLSTFAVGSKSGPEAAPRGCGSCGDPRGPGACQRDFN